MSVNHYITLTRFRATVRSRLLSPFKRVNGEWVTQAKNIYVRRVDGKPMALSMKPLHGYTSLLKADELAFVKKVARRKGWVVKERQANVKVEKYPYLDGDLDCNANLLAALNRVGKRLGKIVFIRSGRRTLEEQTALYRMNMNPATGRPKPGRPLTARPNANAPHTRGIAADCGIDGRDLGDYPGALDACVAEGVGFPVPGEDWHAELTDNMIGANS